VFNILLQLLDDGRLTDAQGRTVDFRNAVVIMTSNVGSQMILERGQSADTGWATVEQEVLMALRGVFKPEFLNRIDDIVVFHPLGRGEIDRIVDLQLGHLRTLLADRKLTIRLTDTARARLADEGYDPVFGARPLKRAVQRMLQNPLAMAVLEGTFKEGDTIVADLEEGTGTLVFRHGDATDAAAQAAFDGALAGMAG
jgi:ATP-dependent Clp protease ATP-binding subunit ClpB